MENKGDLDKVAGLGHLGQIRVNSPRISVRAPLATSTGCDSSEEPRLG